MDLLPLLARDQRPAECRSPDFMTGIRLGGDLAPLRPDETLIPQFLQQLTQEGVTPSHEQEEIPDGLGLTHLPEGLQESELFQPPPGPGRRLDQITGLPHRRHEEIS
jgi:hypothetical protein